MATMWLTYGEDEIVPCVFTSFSRIWKDKPAFVRDVVELKVQVDKKQTNGLRAPDSLCNSMENGRNLKIRCYS
jgi:hypothetical protein